MTVNVNYEFALHEGKNVILIKFPYDKELMARAKIPVDNNEYTFEIYS